MKAGKACTDCSLGGSCSNSFGCGEVETKGGEEETKGEVLIWPFLGV